MAQNTFTSNFCVVSGDNIFLSNDWISFRPAMDDAYKDVNISIDDNGILHFRGHEFQYGISFSKTPVDELEEEPVESCIKHYKGIKLFGWYLSKPYYYVEGWYRLKETKYKEMYKSKFNIKFV